MVSFCWSAGAISPAAPPVDVPVAVLAPPPAPAVAVLSLLLVPPPHAAAATRPNDITPASKRNQRLRTFMFPPSVRSVPSLRHTPTIEAGRMAWRGFDLAAPPVERSSGLTFTARS